MDQPDDLVVVGSFSDRIEAELARGALNAADIDAIIQADDVAGLRPHLALTQGVQVLVRAEDASRAREILSAPPGA